jgi:hypothetical protein
MNVTSGVIAKSLIVISPLEVLRRGLNREPTGRCSFRLASGEPSDLEKLTPEAVVVAGRGVVVPDDG